MGTVAGLRTRRYHGLLVSRIGGPAERMLGLVGARPGARRRRRAHPARNRRVGERRVDPRGHELLVTFELDGRRAALALAGRRRRARARARDGHGRAAVGVVHRLVRADRPVRLELTPLCTWRSVHGERFADGDPVVEPVADGFVFEGAYRVAGAGWTPGGEWYCGVRAREEAARGLNDRRGRLGGGNVRGRARRRARSTR